MPFNKKKKSKGSVSYTLLEKRAIEEVLDKLMDSNKAHGIEKAVSFLLDKDSTMVLKSSLSRLKNIIQSDISGQHLMKVTNLLTVIAEVYTGEGFVPEEIKAAARTPGLSRGAKMLLLSFLVNLGTDEEQIAALIDIDELTEMAEFAADNLAGMARGSLSERLFFLQEFSAFDLDDQEEIMKKLAEDRSDAAAEMLGTLAYTYEPRIVETAVKLLGQDLRARTFAILRELAENREPVPGSIAKRELGTISGKPVRDSKRKWKKPFGEIYDAVVTSFDGKGSRAVWMAWKLPGRKNRLIGVNFLINSSLGIKDCFGTPDLTRKEFDSMVEEISQTASVLRGNPEYCMSLIRGALDKSLAQGLPVPAELAFWRRCLKDEIYCRGYVPSVNSLLPKTQKMLQESFSRTEMLLDYPEFTGWYEETPEVYDIAETFLDVSGRFGDKPIFEERVEQLITEVINRAIRPVIPELRERLLLTADFIKKTGNRNLAGDTMVCLASLDSVPPERHPFIRRMAYESISSAAYNLENGIDIRTKTN
ncbi:MAG: hypothetical protein CVU89_09850 [Firmicutes bacterium HGW-Firmicutes-14]|nr:MAG: hypothetical protein CVU89_09850 [Firmicutes bacterium HGW-Firmicutes-14]